MANAIAQGLARQAVRLIDRLAAMETAEIGDGTPGSVPDQSTEGAATIEHDKYRARIQAELFGILDRLAKMGFALDDDGNLVPTTGVKVTRGIV